VSRRQQVARGRPVGNRSAFPQRYAIVDILRGAAIVLMFIYHFTFDLNYFGAVRFDFNHDRFWLGFRALIVSSFLCLVGVSLTLAQQQRMSWKPYLRRLIAIGLCAVAVTIGSYAMFSRSFIFFGILHFIFVASLLGLMFTRFYWLNLGLGTALIALGAFFSHRLFDYPWLQWVGLMTHKPITEDYVPLLPWFGVVLIGMFVGRLALVRNALGQKTPVSPVNKTLAYAGRHSLPVYMLHQPIFIGVLWLIFEGYAKG
jgi:uncharacterized membrane protein